MSAGYDDLLDEFPPMPFWGTLRDIYAAFFIQFRRILMLTIIPLIFSFIAYLAGDVWLSIQDISPLRFWLTTLAIQGAEIVLFYLFSLFLFRLLLLGPSESLPEDTSERGWLARLASYAVRSLMLFLPLIVLSILAFFVLRLVADWQPVFLFLVAPALVVILFYLFIRWGFSLPAASVDAPYSIFDSWQATKRIGMKALLLTLMAVLPMFILTCVVVLALNNYQPAIELFVSDAVIYQLNTTYWIAVPVGLLLSYFIAAMVVIALAVMFYKRTGWRPGAIRADLS